MLQVLPAMVDELGVHDDLVELALGAVAAHVGAPGARVKVGVRGHAVEDLLEDLLLALGAGAVPPPEHESFQEGSVFGHLRTSFFGAYEVSCRVRAERVKPYAS